MRCVSHPPSPLFPPSRPDKHTNKLCVSASDCVNVRLSPPFPTNTHTYKTNQHRLVNAMRNYARDVDSQDIYLEVAILLTDDRPQAREALIQAGIADHVLELMERCVLFWV